MKTPLLPILGVLAAAFSSGCSETPVSFPLRSLERSGEVSFICVGPNGEGYDINACPDFESTENTRHMLALVTQTLRGEVAIVDLTAGKVVDLDRSTPGYGFIPVGNNPIDIVSTPGGVASFVGVAEVGKEGIFAIPSTCAKPPARDLVTWPACRLPSAPGEMAILVDPPAADGGVRASCDGEYSTDAATPGAALAATRADCAADLALETSPPGRRKLLVTLPTEGAFVILDAQEILDREPGSFDECLIEERYVTPMDELPPGTKLVQKVPADLQGGCVPGELEYGPPEKQASFPAGIDVSDGRLFMADRGNPLVHVFDVHDPCAPIEQPPYVALSYDAPNNANIFTTHVAVSPPTTTGARFAYAVDGDGNVMIFDATPGATDRTPIVRSGSPRLPFEPPDRIQFDSPARGVTFALRDVPIADPETGVASIGTFCNPDPDLDATTPAAKHRPNSDFSSGARAHNLRGVFGFVMLASGQVAVIDVEDFDAACRRPTEANASDSPDFRGCFGDLESAVQNGYTDGQGRRTVSGELSCRMVEQHRARSGRVMINSNDFGVNAPSLRNFPRLSLKNGNLPTNQTDEGKTNPKLLAVDFPDPSGSGDPLPAEVYVGVNRYRNGDANNPLVVDPAVADRASLGLVLQEPRAFFGDEDLRLAYEGRIVTERVGRLELSLTGESRLVDLDGGFCDRGVEGVALMRERGVQLGVASADLDGFAREHADYVQIISELRGKDHHYWVDEMPASCEVRGKAAFFACQAEFGAEPELFTVRRDFAILESYQGDLMVEPRRYQDDAERQRLAEDVYCCFAGSALLYSVRAGSQWLLAGTSGLQHNIVAAPPNPLLPPEAIQHACIRDCSPRNQFLTSRVFEVSSNCTGDECPIGLATDADVACVIDGNGPLEPDSPCVFQNLTHRFAVYRGLEPSTRDMTFAWSVTGGFTPLTASLASQSRAVSPQSIVFVPQIGQLAVADGASEGLVLISLDSVSISRLFF